MRGVRCINLWLTRIGNIFLKANHSNPHCHGRLEGVIRTESGARVREAQPKLVKYVSQCYFS